MLAGMSVSNRRVYSLMPDHPEALTHIIRRRATIRIPKAVYTSLTIPDDQFSADDKNDFAATFLANWASDRSPSRATAQALESWSPWAEYQAWKDSGEREVLSSQCLLQRFHDYSVVTAEKKCQAMARRSVPTAHVGCCDVLPPESDDDYGYDTDDGMDFTPEMMDNEMSILQAGSGARGSLKGALELFGDEFPSPESRTPLGLSCVPSTNVNIRQMVKAASQRNEELSGKLTRTMQGDRLELETVNEVVLAKLVAVALPPFVPTITVVNMSDPEQIPALFNPLKEPPTIQDTISLFTLAPGQAQMFVLMATEADEAMRKEKGLASPELAWFSQGPLRLLVLGPPGTGKTRAQLAFQWYTYQHKLHHRVLLTAYPHKAAALLNSPILTASTTCAMMGIDPIRLKLYSDPSPSHKKSQNLLHGGRWLIMDEVSFFSQTTLALTSRSLQQHALYSADQESAARLFGKMAILLTGDLTQHTPPTGKAVFSGAAWESRCLAKNKPDIRSAVTAKPDDALGRDAFLSFRCVLILDVQHRMLGDPVFASMAASFASEDPVTPAAIDDFCDLVNNSVPNSICDLLGMNPRVVVTRNDVKNHVARALDICQVLDHQIKCYCLYDAHGSSCKFYMLLVC